MFRSFPFIYLLFLFFFRFFPGHPAKWRHDIDGTVGFVAFPKTKTKNERCCCVISNGKNVNSSFLRGASFELLEQPRCIRIIKTSQVKPNIYNLWIKYEKRLSVLCVFVCNFIRSLLNVCSEFQVVCAGMGNRKCIWRSKHVDFGMQWKFQLHV